MESTYFCRLSLGDEALGISVLKLDPLSPTDINRSTSITPSFLLILLLREALSFCHAKILVRPIRVVVRAVRIRSHLWIHQCVMRDALEGRVLLLCELGNFRRGRGGALALCCASRGGDSGGSLLVG